MDDDFRKVISDVKDSVSSGTDLSYTSFSLSPQTQRPRVLSFETSAELGRLLID